MKRLIPIALSLTLRPMSFTFQYEKINTLPIIYRASASGKFTFQYEKINTLYDNMLADCQVLFTFQYEKINTYLQNEVHTFLNHLHSNMKRLIPIAFFALSLKRYFAIICRPF